MDVKPEVVTKSGPGATPKPATPAAPTPPLTAVPPELAALKAEREAFEHSRRLQEVKLNREAQKFKSEREAEKKTWGEKLSRIDKLEKLQANAKLNPDPFLKEILGDNYYEMLTEHRLSGGAPAASIVAAEIAKMREESDGKINSVREEFAKKEAEREAAATKAREEQTANQVVEYIAGFWAANGKDFPAIAAEAEENKWSAEQIASTIARAVKAEYDSTTKTDAAGNIIPGKADPKGVAERWEASLVSRAKRVSALPKYAAPVVPRSEVQPLRRTLSNDLTGSTQAAKATPMTEAEARAKALAARQAYIEGKANRT